MSFIFDPTRAFVGTCRTSDGQKFEVHFNALSDEQVKSHALGTPEGEATFLKAVVRDIPDIQNQDGEQIPFTDEFFDQMLGFAYIRGALLDGYHNAVVLGKSGN